MLDTEWQIKLGINANQYEGALVALTHKSMLNENKELLEKNDLTFYIEIGKVVYEILTKNYIYTNISPNPAVITKGYQYSKWIFIDKFFNNFQLADKTLYAKGISELSDKIRRDLSLQLIGYLYIYTSYKNLYRIFENIFDIKSFIFVEDYLSILLAHCQKENIDIEFKEIAVTGPDHNKEFKYELKCNNISIISLGTSVKRAKYNCAKIYCKKYLSNKLLFELSGIKSPYPRNRKKFIYSDTLKHQIKLLSKSLNIEPQLLIQSLTHSSASNEFNLIDNSGIKGIGSKINILNILIILFFNRELLKDTPLLRVSQFLENQKNIKANFLNSYLLGDSIIANKSISKLIKSKDCIVDSQDEAILEKVYNDVFNSLIFAKFFSYNQYKFIEELEANYVSFLHNADYTTIDPKSDIQEINQSLNKKLIDSRINKNIPTKYTCEYFFIIPDINVQFRKTENSIAQAEYSSAKELIIYFQHNIINFLIGEYDTIDINQEPILVEFLTTALNKDRLFIRKNYFGLNYLKKEEIQKFINIVTNIFRFSIAHHSSNTQSLIIEMIIEVAKKIRITLFNSNYTILTEILIRDIWEICNNSDISIYNLDEHWAKLHNKSFPILKNLIKEDGLFIKNINNPCKEFQLLAIENNSSALSLIKKPCMELFYYISSNYDLYRNFISNESSEVNKILINVIEDDLNNLINTTESSLKYTILKKINFEIYIKAIFKMFEINKISIHTGYVFSSGLKLINEELDCLLNSSGELNLLIGSLKDYYSDEFIKDVDKKTALHINEFINKGATIKTNTDRFYHGKIYCLESTEYKFIIMGSTNLSKNAFHKNDELDCLYIINKLEFNPFYERLEHNWNSGTIIPLLDINKFIESENIINATLDNLDFNIISRKEVEEKIKNIPDQLLRRRLLLWLEHNPSNIYEQLLVANVDYIAIEYVSRNMIVLESFLPGNSYFVFYDIKIDDLLSLIENRTKTEIFELSNMKKRGYHIRDALKLELNIRSYFIY